MNDEISIDESPLAIQVRAAVAAKLQPLEVMVQEAEYGQRLIVGVVGIKEVFAFSRFMADGRRNEHTPETFAAAVHERVAVHIERMLAAMDKRKAKAAKRR